MGGFEWSVRVPAEMEAGVRQAKAHFTQLVNSPDTDPGVRYLAEELADMWIVTSEERNKVCWYTVKETPTGRVEIPKNTYGENFGDHFPNDGEILLYCWEVPWLWEFTAQTKAGHSRSIRQIRCHASLVGSCWGWCEVRGCDGQLLVSECGGYLWRRYGCEESAAR